jgi:hypothetical protein
MKNPTDINDKRIQKAGMRAKSNQVMVPPESNPWSEYGKARSRSRIVGRLLKFTKFGDWVAGDHAEKIPHGTRMVAHTLELLIGWLKWQDGKPVEDQMYPIAIAKENVPNRSELGDTDRSQWPIDDKGVARDPWQFTNYLIMMDEADNLYTFAPSSKSGLDAVGVVATAYGARMLVSPDSLPVVTLEGSSYEHADYGEIRIPVLEVVGWTPRQGIDEVLAAGQAGAVDNYGEPEPEPDPRQPPPPPPKPAPKPNRKARF